MLVSQCSPQAQSQDKQPNEAALEFLGEMVIPFNKQVNNTQVGGLSGLTYNPQDDVFYIISDDRSELADARFYTLKVALTNGKLSPDKTAITNATFLKDENGRHYALGTVDPEGIASGPDGIIYISSEGGRINGTAPFINGYTADGTLARSLPIPERFWAARKADRLSAGIRPNLAFESLTISPNGRTLYAATENALMQDGPEADSARSSPARILAYDTEAGNVTEEFQYNVDPVIIKPGERGPFAVNGLSDLLALNDSGDLLALDRNYVQRQGNHILLYAVSMREATDIKHMPALHDTTAAQAVQKTLLADLNEFSMTIDNFEGLALGPELPDGGRLLLMVSDNNFSDEQKTMIAAFRLRLPLPQAQPPSTAH